MQKNDPIISMNNVMLHYEDSLPVLKNVSINLYKSSFHFLTGESGVGKTTFMRLLYMGIRPSAGVLKIFGKDVSELSDDSICKMRQRIGVVFQSYNLLNHLTALENVALPLKVMGEPESSRMQQAKEILDWVGLGNCFNAYPDALSGGQQQRIAIARAVISRPDILLADEPTGNVDEKIANKLMTLFYGMHKVGTCVIVATHHKQFVDQFHYDELQIDSGKLISKKQVPPQGVGGSSPSNGGNYK